MKVRENVEMFGGVLNMFKALRHGDDVNFTPLNDDDDFDCDLDGAGTINGEGFFELITVVAKELMNELESKGGTQQEKLKDR